VSAGYQGWYDAPGSSGQVQNWWHYNTYSTFGVDYLSPTDYQGIINGGQNGSSPAHGYNDVEFWPDTREVPGYTVPATFGNLGNGQPAQLFSSHDTQTVNTQIKWMSHYGIDNAAIQRFSDFLDFRNDVSVSVMNAAQTYGTKFYIMYDLGGWDPSLVSNNIENDWTNVIVNQLHLTASTAYAKENGKPAVCLWGIGIYSGGGYTPAAEKALIQWFQSQGCYVAIGTARDFTTNSLYASYAATYKAGNMIGDWPVGGFTGISGVDSWMNNVNVPNKAWCQTNGLDYQPYLLPGSVGYNRYAPWGDNPRLHGDLLWEQFKNINSLGLNTAYIAMWDEVSEGTQLIKSAEDSSMAPTRGWFQTLDADRIHISSDFYLKLAGAGGAMLKGYTAPQSTLSVPFMSAPALWSTGFEGADPQSSPTPEAAAVGTDNTNGSFWQRTGETAHIGNNEFMYMGNVTTNAQNQHNFYVKVFDLTSAPITVNSSTSLSYWIRPDQDSARYTGVDLHFTDGTWLRQSAALDTNGFSVKPSAGHGGSIPLGAWTQIVSNIGSWVSGKTIDRIDIGFDRPNAANGLYHGYIDDIAINGIADGVYTIAAAGTKPDGVNLDYNSVLDTNLHQNTASTGVVLGYRLGTNSQKWNVHYQGNNLWDIRVINANGSTGTALDQGGTGADGSLCSLKTFASPVTAAQQWKIAANNGNYTIYSAQPKSGTVYDVLDGKGSSATAGTPVQLLGAGSGAQQQWMFSPATANASSWQIGMNVPIGKTISLQCASNNMYVTGANDTTGLSATKSSVTSNAEQFRVYDQTAPNIALNSMVDHCNVCADNAGAAALIANRTSVGAWETYQWVNNSDGTVSLLAQANGKYVSANNTGSALIANAATIGNTEKFRVILRNAGAYAQIDCGGPVAGSFAADVYSSGGNLSSTTATINTSAAGAAPAAVYQSERWGAMTYTILCPQPSYPYTVKLHFAEIYYTAANQRKFNVAINGTQVLTNYDIFADAGAMNKAVVKTYQTTSDGNGNITISFTTGSVDNPKISGIEVF